MADRLTVGPRALTYPADEASWAIVREAGGLSKLTPAQRASVKLKRVEPGQSCDDLPADAAAARIARGEVIVAKAKPPLQLLKSKTDSEDESHG